MHQNSVTLDRAISDIGTEKTKKEINDNSETKELLTHGSN